MGMIIIKSKNIKENVMHAVFLVAAISSILAVVLICIFLFANGLPAIGKVGILQFFAGTKWAPSDIPPSFGILPMILGSIYVTAGAILIGVPIGIFTATFMAKFCPQPIYKFLKPAVDLLAGIPSVVYGFFGLVIIVPAVRNIFGGNGNSILSASILLGIMILPTIINISETAIRSVPDAYYEGAIALGATHERSIFSVVLPAASPGIMTSVLLGIGRAIGETMAVVMVAGNQARMPKGMLRGVRTLTANVVIEMGYAAELHREVLLATALVLLVLILFINMLFMAIKKRGDNK